MSQAEWEAAYWRAWETYYSDEHVERVMRRAAATGNSVGKSALRAELVHRLDPDRDASTRSNAGFVRLKFRRDRRSGMPIEPALTFYPRFIAETLSKQVRWAWLWGRMYRRYQAIKRDPANRTYMDEALTPVADDESERLEIFQTGEAKAFVAQQQRIAAATTTGEAA